MVEMLKKEVAKRPDLVVIAKLIPPQVRVLDLGCGNGTFLRLLEKEKNVRGLGIEIDQQMIIESIATGISVVQGDLNNDLDFADDGSFDYVVLSRTLQEVSRPDKLLSEIVRVGKKAIVGFINFGYIGSRFQLLFSGLMPETISMPHSWYNTPNIHLATLADFKNLCLDLNIKILREIPIGSKSNALAAALMPNLFAHTCVFELTKK